MIFESLNSTGLDLSEADKVRNLILMSLDADKQKEYYEQYWNVIENNTNYKVSEFIRDFLTCKNRNIPKIGKVYFAFKNYYRGKQFSQEELLKELLEFSDYYRQITLAKHSNKKVNEWLSRLNNLGITVSYPLLLEIFYYNQNLKFISDESLIEILLIFESYIVRRLFCDAPTNALNKVFASVGQEVNSLMDNDKDKYVEILKYVMSQYSGSWRFPQDSELTEKMQLKDFYKMYAKNKHHILSRMENYKNKSLLNIDELITEKKLTIEHIMPQTLNEAWEKTLGDDYAQIYETYLNTLGNLTLTHFNSELGNKPFGEKIKHAGLAKSHLYLNEYILEQTTWNKEKILERAQILAKRAVAIWPYCNTAFKSKKSITMSFTLDDNFNATNKKPKSFTCDDLTIQVDSWAGFIVELCKLLFEKDPERFTRLLRHDSFASLLSDTKTKNHGKIAEGIFMKINYNADTQISNAKRIVGAFGVDLNDVSITLSDTPPETNTENTDEKGLSLFS